MTKTPEHIIWSNYYLDLNDWKDDLEQEQPGLSDSAYTELMYQKNSEYIFDERANLNIQFAKPIIVIGDLGLWNGRRIGYKDIESGNIKDCLYSDCDYNTWYVDEHGDLCCEAIHHDGTNHYRYRVFKPNVTEEQMEYLRGKIYSKMATEKDISAVTDRLGDAIGRVYGWTFPTNPQIQPKEVDVR